MADPHNRHPIMHGTRRFLVLPLLFLAVAASLLPLIETNAWWVRFLDFARIQIVLALLVFVVLYVIMGGWRGKFGWLVVGLGLVALVYHGYRLHPYVVPFNEMAEAVEDCPAESRLRVMVANVQRSNRQAEALFKIAAAAAPDVFLLLETNAWWDKQLRSLDASFPFRVQHIPEEATYFGMHVLSRYRLIDPEVRFFFGADTPTIIAKVRLPDGVDVEFIGLHPRPPQSGSQPTTMRDAHLLASALHAADSSQASVMAGDFNAVPWERTNRRAMRIGRLLDPRAGRGVYPTYDAQSWILSWPLDQILYQDEFGLNVFRKLPSFGSDHYPILADLCYQPALAATQAAPALKDGDLQEAHTAIQAAQGLK